MSRVNAVLAALALASLPVCVSASGTGVRPGDWAPTAETRRIAAGDRHTCVLAGDNSLSCWGSGANGRLGSAGAATQATPVRNPDVQLLVVSNGFDHSCAIRSDHRVACWGAGGSFQLGTSPLDQSQPVVLLLDLDPAGARSVAAGFQFSCAAMTDGTVRCWGTNGRGQMGRGTIGSPAQPGPVTGLADAVQVGAGGGDLASAFACALRSNGRVSCWGSGDAGQLGTGDSVASAAVPLAVANLTDAIGLALGDRHACALRRTGGVVCWGANDSGQLGNGTTTPSNVPVAVSSLTGVTAIEAGGAHTCARRVDGTVRCWGANESGQLGDGTTTTPRLQRVTVSGLSNVVSLAAGTKHTCALLANDTVRCWGAGADGRLGNGLTSNQSLPSSVPGIAGSISARTISAGSQHNCAVRSDGTASCWGNNGNGQLGDGTQTLRAQPVAVAGLANLVTVAAGSFHTCALQVNGLVSCWGSNGTGQLGLGTVGVGSNTPVATTVTDAVALATRNSTTCALRVGGAVLCWGDGRSGQIGNGVLEITPTPTAPTGLGSNVVAIATGLFHACAQRFDGAVRCWGSNADGQVGDGTTTARPTPVSVTGLSDAIGIELGQRHSCAIRVGGAMSCWGANDRGQLGSGTLNPQLVPGVVPGILRTLSIAGGGDTSCALAVRSSTGAPLKDVSCWGRNDNAQTGSVGVDVTSPRTVLGGSFDPGVSAVTVGFLHACALRTGGFPICWGRNREGQMGTGQLSTTPSPTVEVPSFRFNLLRDASVDNAGHAATVAVVASCVAGAKVELQVSLVQGAVTAQGRGVGFCTGALEQYPVKVHTRAGQLLVAGAARGTAVAEVRDKGEVLEAPEWSRNLALSLP